MEPTSHYSRPTFDQALTAWKGALTERGFPTDLLWVFDENLCFEREQDAPGAYQLGFQITFTPPPANAEKIAYEIFAEYPAPIVFYRIGSASGKSVCLILCDDWFRKRTAADDFLFRTEWGLMFHPGPNQEVPEVKDEARWKNRLLRDRPLHDLDFCMPLRTVHEVLAHGRVLSAYERYALRFLHAWRRILGPQH